MRHSSLGRAAIATAGAASTTAHANAGIGFFTPASIVLVVAVIPVILIEAPVLWWRLRIGARRALYVSMCANLVSTLLGAVIGFALDMAVGLATGMMGASGREGVLIALVLMFGISCWLENLVVRRMQPDLPRPAVLGAVLIANLVTYLLLAGVAAATLSPDPMLVRARMTEVVNVAGVAKTDAAEHFHAQGRFRASRQEAPTKYVRRVTTEESGRIVAEIASPDKEELDGKTLVLEPEVREGRIIAWRCYVPEAPLKFFPASCRYRTARGQ